MLKPFLKYYWTSDTIYQIHSPFLYNFAREVLESPVKRIPEIEQIRRKVQRDRSRVQRTDFGAGSKRLTTATSVSNIAKSSISHPLVCQWLLKISALMKPENILELGTSLGISTSYLAKGSPRSHITTVEGDPEIYKRAVNNFLELGINIHSVNNTFESYLENMTTTTNIDLAFLDGHHNYKATTSYFRKLLPVLRADATIIIDDIHWSAEMEAAWEELKSHPKVRFSIDLFQLGILFFGPENSEPEHRTLIPRKYKPWKIRLKD